MGEPRPPAPAPSPPTRTAPSSLLSRLLAFPAARALLALKSSTQLFLPERVLQEQAGGRLLRSCLLSCLPYGLRSSGSRRHTVTAGGPSPPTSAILPGLLASSPSDGTALGLGGPSLLLLCAPLRRLLLPDRGGTLPPLSPPPARSLRPSSASHWNQFLGESGLRRGGGETASLSAWDSSAPTGPCKQVSAVWGGGVGP